MARSFITFLLKIFFGLTTRRKISGLDNIPADEPVIITCNHIGILDGIMIPSIPLLSKHPNLIVVIAEKYQKNPLFNWAISNLGFMFIDRFNPDVKTVRKVIQKLQENGMLIIAPEGTRSPNASLIEAKSGTAYLAAKTGAKIVPAGLTGTEDYNMKNRLKRLRKLDVVVNIGAPYSIPPLPSITSRDEFLKDYTDEIMCRIAALLPASHRGIYANHPRLAVLLDTH